MKFRAISKILRFVVFMLLLENCPISGYSQDLPGDGYPTPPPVTRPDVDYRNGTFWIMDMDNVDKGMDWNLFTEFVLSGISELGYDRSDLLEKGPLADLQKLVRDKVASMKIMPEGFSDMFRACFTFDRDGNARFDESSDIGRLVDITIGSVAQKLGQPGAALSNYTRPGSAERENFLGFVRKTFARFYGMQLPDDLLVRRLEIYRKKFTPAGAAKTGEQVVADKARQAKMALDTYIANSEYSDPIGILSSLEQDPAPFIAGTKKIASDDFNLKLEDEEIAGLITLQIGRLRKIRERMQNPVAVNHNRGKISGEEAFISVKSDAFSWIEKELNKKFDCNIFVRPGNHNAVAFHIFNREMTSMIVLGADKDGQISLTRLLEESAHIAYMKKLTTTLPQDVPDEFLAPEMLDVALPVESYGGTCPILGSNMASLIAGFEAARGLPAITEIMGKVAGISARAVGNDTPFFRALTGAILLPR